MRKIFSLQTLFYFAFALLIGAVAPIVASSLNLTDIQNIQYFLFGLNVIYALLVGFIAGRRHHGWINLLFFPIVFIIGVTFFYSD